MAKNEQNDGKTSAVTTHAEPKAGETQYKQGQSGNAAAPPSIVSSDLTIKGDLVSGGDIHIDGKVHGDVRSSRVTIGETATVDGSVFAEEVVISGSVEGEILSKSVILTKSANVRGDVVHESLSIEAGASIEGVCRRMAPTDKPSPDVSDKDQSTVEAA